jgi:hypothetical protein
MGDATSPLWKRIAWTAFAVLTVTFGLGLAPFTDPRYLGHQAREIMTHAMTSLPLGFAMLALVHRASGAMHARRDGAPPRLLLASVVVIPICLAIGVLTQDAMATGQTDRGLAAMVAAHFFEHALDYVLISCLAVGLQSARVYFSLTQTSAAADAGGDV